MKRFMSISERGLQNALRKAFVRKFLKGYTRFMEKIYERGL
jgi:hypothetical protein